MSTQQPHPTSLRHLSLIALFSATLSACGGGDDTPATSTPAPAPIAGAPAPAAAPAIASYAGTYTGTYSGVDSGTFSVVIDTSGRMTGQGTLPAQSETFTVVGQLQADGAVSMNTAGLAGSGEFSGSVSAAGVISGTWRYLAPNVGTGTFTGIRSSVANTPATSGCNVLAGDNRLVFQNAPTDFCGFVKSASFANNTATYYEFESTASTGPIPNLVKFYLVGDIVDSMLVEDLNKGYQWGCGNAVALGYNYGVCSGVSTSTVNNFRQFTLNNANLRPNPTSANGQILTVNGLLIQP